MTRRKGVGKSVGFPWQLVRVLPGWIFAKFAWFSPIKGENLANLAQQRSDPPGR